MLGYKSTEAVAMSVAVLYLTSVWYDTIN